MQKITKAYSIFYKFAARMIARHYFKILKGKFQKDINFNLNQTPTTVIRLRSVQRRSLDEIKVYPKYLNKIEILDKKLLKTNEIKQFEDSNYRQITPEELI